MIQLRHTGLYVNNLKKMTHFYHYVFQMYIVCENIEQGDALINDLFKQDKVRIRLSKLITEQGKSSGIDDMLELIQVVESDGCILDKVSDYYIYLPGTMHLGFGVDNIESTVLKVVEAGGKKITDIHLMDNGNKCCFCRDSENNWIEIIERKGELKNGN